MRYCRKLLVFILVLTMSFTFTVIPANAATYGKVSRVALGNLFSLMVDTDGNMYGWGNNDYSQIVLHYTIDASARPVLSMTDVKEIAVSSGRSPWQNNMYVDTHYYVQNLIF